MTEDAENNGTALPPLPEASRSQSQLPEKPGGLSFDGKDLHSKSGLSEERRVEKNETAVAQLFSIGVFDRFAGLQLQQFFMMPGSDRDLLFARHVRAVAAAADGLGLSAADPVVALVQRGADFASLAMIAEVMGADAAAPIHTVSLFHGSTTGNSPELLAGRLAEELKAGKLDGDFILLVLPAWAITPAWENIQRDDAETPLKQFLLNAGSEKTGETKTGKRLIIGIEPPPLQHLSQLVNSETGLSSLPWGLPFLAQLAVQNNFRTAHFDRALVKELDAESTWESFRDDQREVGRSVQFAGAKTRYREPGEMTGKLQALLKETNFSLDYLWQLSTARADDAIGLGRKAVVLGEEIKAPAAIKRGLLCSAAFATDLPSGRFLAIVRASLPEGQTVGLPDITKEEYDEVMQLAGLQGFEHKTLPPMPTVRAYFDDHVDRICQAYDITTDENGITKLAGSWRSFQLAGYICTHAPSVAMEYAKRLLSGAKDIGDLGTGQINPIVRIIATLQCHLSSGISRPQLADWLLGCAVPPIKREYLRATQEDMPEKAEGVSDMPAAKPVVLTGTAEVAKAVAKVIIEFLTELRTAAAGAALQSSVQREKSIRHESIHLRHAVLDRIDNWRLAVMLTLFMILMDEDARPEEHDALEIIVQKTIVDRAQMDFVLKTVSFYFNRLMAGDAEARCADACRLIEFFARAAGKADSHPAWGTARDKILAMLLAYDIRWPPGNVGLLPYEKHARWVALELVVDGEDEAVASAISRRGCEIVIAHFLARGASGWLADSWQKWAQGQAPDRLYDTVMVLLDGPPATTRYWASRDFSHMADRLANALVFECGASGLSSLADYAKRLGDCPDYVNPPVGSRPYVRLYWLFWPALLLFWRLRLFGVEPLDAADPRSARFRAFLEHFCTEASSATVAIVADGMKQLVAALDRTVLAAIPRSDLAAHAFYTRKRGAAARLEEFLRKRVQQAGQSSNRFFLGNRSSPPQSGIVQA